MKTITEHLDDLDRMVDAGNTPKHELRSQVAFIQREVAALQEDYLRLAEAHTQLQNASAKQKVDADAKYDELHAEHEKLKLPPPDGGLFVLSSL
jgi:predicted  nucleic acid-binding Zn-ribbon protein